MMQKQKTYGWFILMAFALLAGCREVELPDPVIEEAPFKTVLLGANGTPLYTFDVNQENYYLFTDFGTDALGVPFYEGRFAQLDCSGNCGPSLRIQIRDQEVGIFTPDELLLSGTDLSVQQPLDSIEVINLFYLLNFTGTSTSGPLPGDWIVDGAPQGLGQDTFSLTMDSVQVSEVCFSISNPAFGCITQQCREIDPNVPSSFALSAQIQGDSIGGGILETFVQGGQGPYTFNWSTGSNSSSIVVNQPGPYCVTVTDATGLESISCANVPQSPGQELCVASFFYETTTIVETEWVLTGDSLGLGQVVIELEEADGTLYRSDFGPQDNDARLVINEVLTFADNEKGQATRRLIGNFSCTLYDENGENPIQVQTEGLDFAVAIP
jgi:hypothetical protein